MIFSTFVTIVHCSFRLHQEIRGAGPSRVSEGGPEQGKVAREKVLFPNTKEKGNGRVRLRPKRHTGQKPIKENMPLHVVRLYLEKRLRGV